jgi:hypothetical protein
MVRGGDSGPAVVPGRPDESLLLEALQYESLEMPPAGPLHKNQIEGIKAWIEAQAPWPDGVVLQPQSSETTADRDWWCYQPVVDFAVPEVKDGGWCRNDIDRFIFARMTAAGIEPSDEATRPTLARRRMAKTRHDRGSTWCATPTQMDTEPTMNGHSPNFTATMSFVRSTPTNPTTNLLLNSWLATKSILGIATH